MGGPTRNQFWKFRSKHGRDKLFSTPHLLWQAAEQYFQWCDENPWYKHDFVGKDAEEVWKETERPYTLTGFCLYAGASESWWRKFRTTEGLSDDFFTVITRIEEVIATQQFEGASVGAFNANIISRKLGLADKAEVTGKDGGAIQTESKFEITLNLNK